MKKCSYCAQEIQSDAIVCRFCNQHQPAPRLGATSRKGSYTRSARLVAFVAGSVVAMMVWAQRRPPATFEERPKKALDVSGVRHQRGVDVTNNETDALAACVVSIREPGSPEGWRAVIQKLAPMETETLTWSRFSGVGGSEMPSYLGLSARYATVTCESHKGTRKGAAIAFRRP